MWGKAPEVLARMGDDFLVVAPFDGHRKTRVNNVSKQVRTRLNLLGVEEVGMGPQHI